MVWGGEVIRAIVLGYSPWCVCVCVCVEVIGATVSGYSPCLWGRGDWGHRVEL